MDLEIFLAFVLMPESAAFQGPLLLAYLAGIALTRWYRRCAPRACMLATFAFSLMFISPVGFYITAMMSYQTDAAWYYYALFGINTAAHFVGVLLLAIAVVTGRAGPKSHAPALEKSP